MSHFSLHPYSFSLQFAYFVHRLRWNLSIDSWISTISPHIPSSATTSRSIERKSEAKGGNLILVSFFSCSDLKLILNMCFCLPNKCLWSTWKALNLQDLWLSAVCPSIGSWINDRPQYHREIEANWREEGEEAKKNGTSKCTSFAVGRTFQLHF